MTIWYICFIRYIFPVLYHVQTQIWQPWLAEGRVHHSEQRFKSNLKHLVFDWSKAYDHELHRQRCKNLQRDE
jgi:hypothetical protein